MAKGSKTRQANGVVSAAIVVFFLAHGTLGSVALLTGFIGPLAWLVWVGVGLVAVHVVLSVVTSYEQLADAERPPSARKKRHLALKWATGGVLAAVAAVHVLSPQLPAMGALNSATTSACLIALLSIVLAVHLCVGAKSLLKDIGIDRSRKVVFRVVVCAFAAAFVVAVFVSLAR